MILTKKKDIETALEETIRWLCKVIPVQGILRQNGSEPLFDEPLRHYLQQEYHLSPDSSWRYVRAAYWHFQDLQLLCANAWLMHTGEGCTEYSLLREFSQQEIVEKIVPAIYERYYAYLTSKSV